MRKHCKLTVFIEEELATTLRIWCDGKASGGWTWICWCLTYSPHLRTMSLKLLKKPAARTMIYQSTLFFIF